MSAGAALPEDAGLPRHAPGIGSGLGVVALYFVLQLVLGTVLAVGFAFVQGLAMALQGQAGGLDAATLLSRPDVKSGLMAATIVMAALAMFWMVLRRWPAQWRVPDPPGFGFVRPQGRWYGYAVAAGVLVALLGGLLTRWLAPGGEVQQDVTVMSGQVSPAMRWVMAVLVVCVAPLVEELIFRGVLLSGLMRRLRAVWAVPLSAAIFGIVHLPDFGFAWHAVPALVGLGLVLALLRLRSRSLWPAVTAHAANNLLAVAGWFVVVS